MENAWTLEDLPRVPTAGGITGQVPFDGTQDGSYECEITVYDQANQPTTEVVTVRLDTTDRR